MSDRQVIAQNPALPCTITANGPTPDGTGRRDVVYLNCLIVGWESGNNDDDEGRTYVPIVFGLDKDDWTVRQYATPLHDTQYAMYSVDLTE